MTRLQTDSLTYHYPRSDQPALKDLSVTIQAGEFVGVIGPNNSGKSSLCYAMTGVIPHLYPGRMNGNVLVNGTDTRTSTIAEIARHVGLVLQVPTNQLSGIRYTVFEEVAFGLENRGVPRDKIRQRVETVLAILGLTNHATRAPTQLSGGEQQRLALATVLAIDPAALILDEPTTFLDPQGAQQVFDILRRLQQQGTIIMIAEHRLDLVAEYADRVLVLNHGRLLLDGPPDEVLTSPLMHTINLDWTRYTQVAALAKADGLWPTDLPLSASLSGTLRGLQQGRKKYGITR